MADARSSGRERFTIAILALGGQGGGVLTNWIGDLANANGFVVQGTSIAGVAQRTGSTVYYIEMIRRLPGDNRDAPVLALNPVPGDVDIVIASELMETGRAMLRDFVSRDRTTLIGSTHRIYAISEKSALGDGRARDQRIIDAAHRKAKRFIGFDMDAAAGDTGSAISAVMLGALAGSGALPFSVEAFENAIKRGGKAVAANLGGFSAGRRLADTGDVESSEPVVAPVATSALGRAKAERVAARLPESAHGFALEGVRRLMDYQDARYADLYLDRVEAVAARDQGVGDHELTREVARHLALWMSYEDVIRIADLKTRATRFDRIEDELKLQDRQLYTVTEYMHPRLQEVCEMLPRSIGAFILARPKLVRRLEPLFAKGRHVETTSMMWHLALNMLAAMRRLRRGTLRYSQEQGRIEAWLAAIGDAAVEDSRLAIELARNQRLIKGYGDTFERGLSNFERIMAAAHGMLGRSDAAEKVQALRASALADDTSCALDAEMAKQAA